MGCCLNRNFKQHCCMLLAENSQGRGLAGRPLRELSGAGTGSSLRGPERRDGQEQQIPFSLRRSGWNRQTPGGGAACVVSLAEDAGQDPRSPGVSLGLCPLSFAPNTSLPSERAGAHSGRSHSPCPTSARARRYSSCNQWPCSEPKPWVPALSDPVTVHRTV